MCFSQIWREVDSLRSSCVSLDSEERLHPCSQMEMPHWVISIWWKKQGSSLSSFIKVIITFMGVPLSWPNYLLNVSPTITIRIVLSLWMLERHRLNHSSPILLKDTIREKREGHKLLYKTKNNIIEVWWIVLLLYSEKIVHISLPFYLEILWASKMRFEPGRF